MGAWMVGIKEALKYRLFIHVSIHLDSLLLNFSFEGSKGQGG